MPVCHGTLVPPALQKKSSSLAAVDLHRLSPIPDNEVCQEAQVEHKTWTDEELMSLPDGEGKYELVDGELIMVGTGFLHEILIARLS